MTENSAGPLADKTVYELLATTEAVIRDLGRWEYVYSSASGYVYRDERGAPSCLIGHVLCRWGVLDQAEEGMALGTLRALGASREVAEAADRIQKRQDGLATWGEALGAGYEFVRLHRTEGAA